MAPWDVPELSRGLLLGVAAAAVLGLAVAVWLPRRAAAVPMAGGGLALAGASVVAVGLGERGVPVAVVAGVAAVALGTWASRRGAVWVPAGWAVVALGAWTVAFHGEIRGPSWVRVLAFGAASLGALLAAETDDAWRVDAPGHALVALSALGAYYAVPDTEQVAALLGVALPIAALGWPVRAVRLGAGGAAAAVALLGWAAAAGAHGRPASMIGATACLGVLVGAPVGRALILGSGRCAPRGAPAVAWLLVAQGAIMVVASRLAGSAHEVWPATAVSAVAGVMAVTSGAVIRPERA